VTFSRHRANPEGRDRRAVAERLVINRRQPIEQIEGIGVDLSDVMIGAVTPGDLGGVGRLVPALGAERDREGADRLALQPCHHRDDSARIDTARKKSAERYIGDHPHADGLAQARDQLLLRLFAADRGAVDKAHIPV